MSSLLCLSSPLFESKAMHGQLNIPKLFVVLCQVLPNLRGHGHFFIIATKFNLYPHIQLAQLGIELVMGLSKILELSLYICGGNRKPLLIGLLMWGKETTSGAVMSYKA